MWLDGEWRETRRQQKAKGGIDGKTQTLGFGDRSEKTYVEVLTNNPIYAEYIMNDGKQDHIDVKKFAGRVGKKESAIVVVVGKAESLE